MNDDIGHGRESTGSLVSSAEKFALSSLKWLEYNNICSCHFATVKDLLFDKLFLLFEKLLKLFLLKLFLIKLPHFPFTLVSLNPKTLLFPYIHLISFKFSYLRVNSSVDFVLLRTSSFLLTFFVLSFLKFFFRRLVTLK